MVMKMLTLFADSVLLMQTNLLFEYRRPRKKGAPLFNVKIIRVLPIANLTTSLQHKICIVQYERENYAMKEKNVVHRKIHYLRIMGRKFQLR